MHPFPLNKKVYLSSLVFFLLSLTPIVSFSQDLKKDTVYTNNINNQIKISTHRDGLKQGLYETTYTISGTKYRAIGTYIHDKKQGLFIDYTDGELKNIDCFMNDQLLFSEYYVDGKIKSRSAPNVNLGFYFYYDTLGILEELRINKNEYYTFYPNSVLQSAFIKSDHGKSYSYFEFHENGSLKTEGAYLDSFEIKYDTSSYFSDSEMNEQVDVTYREIPIKTNTWYHYNTEGILEKKEDFH